MYNLPPHLLDKQQDRLKQNISKCLIIHIKIETHKHILCSLEITVCEREGGDGEEGKEGEK